MKKIILHTGFHKTGTSSLQFFLKENMHKLSPFAAFYFFDDLAEVSSAARLYGKKPLFWNRIKFRSELRRFLESIEDRKSIVISCESLCGVMPGYNGLFRKRVKSYVPTARVLTGILCEELRSQFGGDVDILLLYTTRDSKPWLKSVFGHISRTKGGSENFLTFRNSFLTVPNLVEEAEKITANLTGIRIKTASLEKYTQTKYGPAMAVLEQLDLPLDVFDGLVAQDRRNVG
jgi:hypothetical protein